MQRQHQQWLRGQCEQEPWYYGTGCRDYNWPRWYISPSIKPRGSRIHLRWAGYKGPCTVPEAIFQPVTAMAPPDPTATPLQPLIHVLSGALSQSVMQLNQSRVEVELSDRHNELLRLEIDNLRSEAEHLRYHTFNLQLQLQNSATKIRVLQELNQVRRELLRTEQREVPQATRSSNTYPGNVAGSQALPTICEAVETGTAGSAGGAGVAYGSQ